MSRAKATDVSSPISLFPFIGVLLCTMGALLVVLIAVSPSAREVALRQAAERRPPRDAEADHALRDKLREVDNYLAELGQVRSKAQSKLREDQLRLSHLENHMRRLQERLHSLQMTATELLAIEEEHYDDREQAEREVGRLEQLIASTREAIDSIRQEQGTKKRSYALVPYEGANGTTRRPIYVECAQGEVILQPEGVRITEDDLSPPLGPGNPLASALRAARDHLVNLYPEEGRTRDTEPYPLVIVRPSGTLMYSRAQKAIQTGDFNFGYELVEEDWELKYPTPDPQLAVVAQQAIDQARVRIMALAAAAPRAYRHPGLAASGRFEFDDAGYGARGFPQGGPPGAASPGAGPIRGVGVGGVGTVGQHGRTGNAHGNSPGNSSHAGDSGAGGDGGPHHGSGAGKADSDKSVAANRRDGEQSGDGSSGEPAYESATDNPNGVPGGPFSSGGGARAPTNGTATTAAPAGGHPQGSAIVSNVAGSGADAGTAGAMNTGVDYSDVQTDLAKSRGNDWALRKKNARAFAVRRTIQVIVRQDHVALLSDDIRPNAGSPVGKTVPLKGDTVESIDEFVEAVHDQIGGWGMAGDGLYWRPVLSLHIGPDGARRAEDLRRLLKNSGLELQPAATANRTPQGTPSATTRRN